MTMGEAFLSSFLQVLFDRLASRELLQFLCQEGLYSRIKKWEETLEIIQALLSDAEEKQLTNTAVKRWLDNLQDLAYDVEDVLDEFATEAIARKVKIQQQQASKVWNHVPACFCSWSLEGIKFRNRMRSKVNDVTRRFDDLCKLRHDLGLSVSVGAASSGAAPRRPPSTSHPFEPAVYGRDADKAKILEMVLKNEPANANFLVVPIVGMGGIGKTTLAREVFNASEVDSFEVKAWVCVSDGDFDVTRVSRLILENITGSCSSQKDFNTVQNELKQELHGKRFLLVLDDIWSIDYGTWEILQCTCKTSALVSGIIVTTRHQKVASTITLNGFHSLDVLSNDDCWSVFSMCAFEKNEAISAHRDGKLIHAKVIEKSKGLPLAAKTLGGLLRSKQMDEWLGILDSKLWDLSENEKSGIPTALKLSYHHLPSHLKRCFAYCAIFPKDYEFEEEELVLLWIAEGFVQQCAGYKQLEDLGREYFKDLLSRSMFQKSSSNYNSSKIVIHDLVHDLAEWALGETNMRLDDVLAANKQQGELKKVRYLSYIVDRYDVESKFSILHEAKDLMETTRTFLPMVQGWVYDPYITNSVPSDLLPKLKKLRVLSLRSYRITKLPDTIGGLKLLRYLDLSQTKLISLPESISLLYNLQILMLRSCTRLVKLPSDFKFLIKLRHFDIGGSIFIEEMPLGMKELKSLQILSNFIMGKNVGSNLKDLKCLNMLRGKLCISKLDNVVNCDKRDLILRDKKDLKELLLEWGLAFDDSRNEILEQSILDMLRPHQNLEKLTITSYGGTRFPCWLGDSSFSNMTMLRLQSCQKCKCLPPLGLLARLKDLTIKGMKRLEHVGSNFYGEGCVKSFQSLKTLHLEDMPQWENWEPIKENEDIGAFPCLREFFLVNCPKLRGRLPHHLPLLEKLVIKNCKQLVVSFSNIPMLCKLQIDGCKEWACNSPTNSKSLKSLTLADISEFGNWIRQQNFLQVEHLKLKIMGCEQLINLWQLNETLLQQPPQGSQSFNSIRELWVENCSNFDSFPEVCFLLNLSKLEIINCNALTSLPEGMIHKNARLESLEVQDCNSLTVIIRGQLPPSLKRLELENCEKLEYLWDGKDNSNNTNTSLLEFLQVSNCPSLKCLSSSGQLPETLQHLDISNCSQLSMLSASGHLPDMLRDLSLWLVPKLESIAESFDHNKALEEIKILFCDNLKTIPDGLRNLSHLRSMVIFDCGLIHCFAEEGLPTTNLSELFIGFCKNLKALPNQFHSLSSLNSLQLYGCPSMTSFPEEGFPTNLTSLMINGEVKIYKPLLEWGLHNLTSLTSLYIWGFPLQEKWEIKLPHSLTYLYISKFPSLSLMGDGFQNLNSLSTLYIYGFTDLTFFPELALPSSLKFLTIHDCLNLRSFSKLGLPSSLSKLWIWGCPEVKSFPKQGLPISLMLLHIRRCPKLKEECKRDKGKEWSKISRIPCVEIDGKLIF